MTISVNELHMPGWLYEEIKDNPASLAMLKGKNVPLTSLIQEALVISSSYINKPRGMLVVQQNL